MGSRDNPVMPYWRLSGIYFIYFAVVGVISPYWSLYLDSLQFSAQEIGVLASIPWLTKLFAPNIWGWISDKFGRRDSVTIFGALGACVFSAGIIFYTDYWPLLILLALYSIFWNAILPQFEATTLMHLKDRSHDYSKIRVWGSIGFIATVLALGALLEFVEIKILPIVIFLLLFGLFLFTCSLPKQQKNASPSAGKEFLRLLIRPHVAVFYFVLFLLQFSHGVYYVFYSLYLSMHQYSEFVIGCFWTLGVLAEIVIFIKMPALFSRYSRFQLLSISLFLTAVRWCLIGLFPHVPFILVTAQLLHALSFGVVHAIAIDFIKFTFSDNSQGQAQAFYSAVSFGAGASLGAFVSGVLWESSPSLCFFIAGFSALISWLITLVILKNKV